MFPETSQCRSQQPRLSSILNYPTPPPNTSFGLAAPVAPVCEWATAIDEGGLTFTDASPAEVVLKPYEASDASRVLLERPPGLAGTTLRLRLRYLASDTPSAPPLRVRVFGRAGEEDPWEPLSNALGDRSVEITQNAAEDVYENGNYRLTSPHIHAHAWDCDGCRFFLVLVEVVYGGASASSAKVQAKIV